MPSTWPIDGQATWFASFFSKRGFSRRTARSRFSFIFPWSWPVHRRLQRRVAGIDFEWRITRGPSSASFPATGVPLGRGYIYVLTRRIFMYFFSPPCYILSKRSATWSKRNQEECILHRHVETAALCINYFSVQSLINKKFHRLILFATLLLYAIARLHVIQYSNARISLPLRTWVRSRYRYSIEQGDLRCGQ